MFIKRIEIFGFKSFKNKTVLDFENQDITGVVGPNGCGKSNIVDALLWVMGENSPKTLRGESLSDIIFGGTSQTAPGQLAEVKLILRAGEQGFPAMFNHFSEVMITRRSFRDGKSETFINDKECLLKDIREFFMNTGAGCKGFSIIEQASIEKLITAKPLQRRFIIEEVAGITKFKSQKSESLRKLNLVNQNLKRVEDVLKLQTSQLQHLKSQAKKAEKYKKLKKELESKEQTIYLARYHSFVADQASITKEIQKKEQELTKTQDFLKTKKASLKTLSQKREKHQEKNKQIQEELNAIQLESAYLQDKVKSFEWVKNLQSQLEAAKAEEQKIHSQIFKFNPNFDPSLSLNDLKRESVKMQAFLDEKQKNQQALKVHTDLLKNQIEFVQKEIQNFHLEKQEFEEKIKQNIQNKNRVTEQLKKHKKQWALVEKSLKDLQAQEKLAFQKKEKAESQWRDLSLKLSAFNHKQQAMEKILKKFDSLNKAGQQLIESLPDQFYSLSKSLEVDADYAKALSAVLGPLDQALVPKDFVDLEWAVEKLKKDKSGKIYFLSSLPQAPVDREQKEAIKAYPAVVAFLDEKVKWKWDYSSLKKMLELSAVVSDLKSAYELKKQFPAFQFVTLEGDFVRRDSFVYAGSSHQDNSFFEIRRQVEEINKQLVAKKVELSAKELEKNSCLQQWNQIQQKRKETEKQFSQLSRLCEGLKTDNDFIHQDRLRNTEMRDRNHKKIKDFEIKKESLREHQALSNKEIKQQEQLMTQKHSYFKILTQALENKKTQEKGEREKTLLLNVINSSKNSKTKLSLLELEKTIKKNKKQKGDLEGQMSLFKEEDSRFSQEKNQLELKIKQLEQVLFDLRLSINQQLSEKDKKEIEKTHIQEQFQKSYNLEIKNFEGEELTRSPEEIQQEQTRLQEQLDRIKEVNFLALKEYEELNKEHNFLIQQKEDLVKSQEGILKLISHIDRICRSRFNEMLEEINKRFSKIFPMVFQGDKAKAELILCEDNGEQGVDILIHPPGKKLQSVSLLSRGEKALTAVCLIYSLFLVKPSPFCIIDEADAPLDDANIFRFLSVLKEMSKKSQMIVITHNKYTMQNCDKLYGVTQEQPGISQIVSVDLKSPQNFPSPVPPSGL